jgi:NADPH:quinone reductase-like Zn-dependent oxidoreductase
MEIRMKSFVLTDLKSDLVPNVRPELIPAAHEVVIQISAAALNRRDHWIRQGMYPGITLPIVLGSDGVGVVLSVGHEVENVWGDHEVIINPGWNWGADPLAQSNDFEILGLPHDGTFAEQVSVPAEFVHRCPPHLSLTQSAALPLAGVTAFRALFSRGQLQPGENVLVTGVGGGVATFAVQFAKAAGANVFVTSSSEAKISAATAFGAIAGYDYRQPDWHTKLRSEYGPMNLTIDGAGGPGYAALVDLAAPGGRIVNYGNTAGPPEKLDMFRVFWKQLNLLGTTMGSPTDFASMLTFVNEHKIEPVIDQVFSFSDVNAALSRMSASEQFGKIVLSR